MNICINTNKFTLNTSAQKKKKINPSKCNRAGLVSMYLLQILKILCIRPTHTGSRGKVLMKENYCSSLSGVLKSQRLRDTMKLVTVSTQAELLGLLKQCILLKVSFPPKLFSVSKAFRFPRTVCGFNRLPPFSRRLFV